MENTELKKLDMKNYQSAITGTSAFEKCISRGKQNYNGSE